MKKIILLTLATLACSFAFAQKQSSGSKNIETSILFQTGNAPVSFFTPNLKVRYFIKEGLAGRVSFLFESNKETIHFAENANGTGGKGFATNKSSSFAFAPGIEKHLKGTSKVSPYIGGILILTFNGASSEWENTIDQGNTFAKGVKFKSDGVSMRYVGPPNEYEAVDLAGSSIGISLVLGADYYVTDGLYIGAEVLWGWQTFSSREITMETTLSNGNTNKVVLPNGSESGFGIATSGVRLGWKF